MEIAATAGGPGLTGGVAWCEGRWGTPAELSLPLDDRGLQLADGLFETVLIRAGQPCLLDEHLQRWGEASALLGLDPPPDRDHLMPLIQEAVQRALPDQSCGALRLNWSRGSSPQRGIAPPHSGGHRFWLTLQPWAPIFTPITAIISRLERRNSDSLLSRCKTFAYGQAVQAKREASQRGCDDALLLNTKGELCCSTTANLLLKRDGAKGDGPWLTPPLSSGCLPGVMRARTLRLGLAVEADLGASLGSDDQLLLINSLGCRGLLSLDHQPLHSQALGIDPAESLWQKLLS